MINPPALNTQQKLPITANRIFAEKGYQEATVAEICKQAETNIASVNYHFGDKENLYLEAWRDAFKKDLQAHPSDGGVNPDTSAEDRLKGRIQSLIARIADPNSHFFAIVHKEMAFQTCLLEKIMAQEINPERKAMNALIQELLGKNATKKQVKFCHASIIGQCFHLLKVKHIKLNDETQDFILNMDDAEDFSNHIMAFSLTGIQAMRQLS